MKICLVLGRIEERITEKRKIFFSKVQINGKIDRHCEDSYYCKEFLIINGHASMTLMF